MHDRMPDLDNTLPLLLEGYGWLPNLRRRTGDDVVRTRLLGMRVTALCGPEAARFFYDEDHIRRADALPGPIKSTLTGHGAVHTLDGADHRLRKAMFMSLMTEEGVRALVGHTVAAWDDAVASWPAGRPVVLFDEVARVLTRGVCRWAGVPLAGGDVNATARALVALVDGFATGGPRHWRARAARGRLEAWLAGLVRDVRDGVRSAPAGSAVEVVAGHRGPGGEPLDPRVAAVELLNVIRPTVAVCWYVTFAAHALHRWPEQRAALREVDDQSLFAEMFAQEVRRFYPFAPFVGGRAVRDLTWKGRPIGAGSLVLLDIYGQNHDPSLWKDPYTFDPQRFAGHRPGSFDLIPQGGGDPDTGHRCPGDAISVALLRALSVRLARLDHRVPAQDLRISLRRIPARPASGFLLTPVRPAGS
ncbi:cytochrome P450 [Streptosporangium sp. NPDC023615]|uniref:cytochrome P450 n=1 Tax=Streptosporangium sp. NPDC023615 TaxID=3154794 RepID=UPI0034460461